MCEGFSSQSRHARIVVDALDGDGGRLPALRLARSQMLGDHVPYRYAILLVDRSPAGDLVALGGVELAAVIELQVGDSLADAFRWRAGVGKAADADHVAALLVIGIGVEEVVADVFEDVLDLAAGHALHVSGGVGDPGLRPKILHGGRVAGERDGAPPKARGQGQLGGRARRGTPR